MEKQFEICKKELLQEIKSKVSNLVKNYSEELYNSLKEQFETVVVKSEDEKKQPFVAKINTDLKIIENKDGLSVQVVAENELDRDIIIAACHGTGLGIRPDMIKRLSDVAGVSITNPTTKKSTQMENYYIDPSSADVKMIHRFKNATIKDGKNA